MAVLADREYVCGYPKCLHHGDKVRESEAVVIGKKHYHWDCAAMKKDIKDCVDSYIGLTGDNSQFPIVTRIINTLVFKNKVPVEFIKKNIDLSSTYYLNKPVYILYGLRKLFWEIEFNMAKEGKR